MMKENIKLYSWRFGEAILFVACIILMWPIIFIYHLWNILLTFYEMMIGTTTFDFKHHLQFWKWDSWWVE